MKIVQTINYIESYEHMKDICHLINESLVDGLRLNFCKYTQEEEMFKAIKEYFAYFSSNGINNIYMDIPYPLDKARVEHIKNKQKNVKQGEQVFICKKNVIDKIQDNNIYVRCDKFNDIKEIIYYGDGEGALKVVNKSENFISCIALNDFYLINGKSLTCGFRYLDIHFLERLQKILDSKDITLLIPFVESNQQIDEIRSYISSSIKLVSKIETEKGLLNLNSIADVSDGILIARGDLPMHSNIQDLYKKLSTISTLNKPIIFCTGILSEFCNSYLPNRAELFDLLSIKNLGTDEIILSGGIKYKYEYLRVNMKSMVKELNKKVEFIRYVWREK